ncbi:MAG: YqgE/AlgH family protein [Deltaproteobacteria bacterium]|nr:YqgE/AlgH family protein [Deltaproteobacteria bacterium]
MDSLQGNFLIATPQMPDPRFQKQVILLCSHSDKGAMGLIINRPAPYSICEILRAARLSVNCEGEWPPIYSGGPVEPETAFFLYGMDYKNKNDYVSVSPGLNLSRDSGILVDIAHGRGPKKYLLLLGYAGWAAGQLEAELSRNGWLTVPGENEILFDTPDEMKWQRSAAGYGIDISLYSDVAGSA